MKRIKYLFLLIKEWVKNLWFVLFTEKSQLHIFIGAGRNWMAKKYADKRTEMSKVNEVCGGRRHFVIKSGSQALVVLNKSEINLFKKKGMIKKQVNIARLLETAVYISK